MDQMYWWIGFVLFWTVIIGLGLGIAVIIVAFLYGLLKMAWRQSRFGKYFDYLTAKKKVLDLEYPMDGFSLASDMSHQDRFEKKHPFLNKFKEAIQWRLANDPKVKEGWDRFHSEQEEAENEDDGGLKLFN